MKISKEAVILALGSYGFYKVLEPLISEITKQHNFSVEVVFPVLLLVCLPAIVSTVLVFKK